MAATRNGPQSILKALTGIAGFDEITGGGVPRGKVTVIIGDAGSGKTVFALQTLANAARDREEPGIFIAFEESTGQIVANASSFGWSLERLSSRKLLFVDARLPVDVVQSGSFELTGVLAAARSSAASMKAQWIVFDAVDVLLDLLPDDRMRRREVARLREWIATFGLTCLLTVKANPSITPGQDTMSYMTDCAVHLQRRQVDGVIARSLTIRKYRGSQYSQNSVPYLIGVGGIAIYTMPRHTSGYKAFTERISTGVERLDSLLGNGVVRGGVTLLTGAPGTAKTTLSCRFAEAACERKERVFYACFDESGAEMIRNMRSVGVDLGRHQRSGLLRIEGMVSQAQNSDAIIAEILAVIDEHRPAVIVLDPLSALLKQGGARGGRNADIAFRVVQQCKLLGITLCITSLVDQADPAAESTELHVSTLADTWIHLSYLVRSGERNRAITVVKSRGSCHSNQVRELILSSGGISLENVYSEEGEVLMGTMRSQHEARSAEARYLAEEELSRKRVLKQGAVEQLQARIGDQRLELKRLKRELAADAVSVRRASARNLLDRKTTSIMRSADAPKSKGKRK